MLARRASQRVIRPPSTARDDKRVEPRGTIVHVGAPVRDSSGQLVGAMRGGVRVRIDRNELQQVLIHHMVNALHATGDGGTITLATSDRHEGDTRRGARIDVVDTGSGISRADIGRLFDPFFTTKRSHDIGLGLSISLSLVGRYGGNITVAVSYGRGQSIHGLVACRAAFRYAALPDSEVR